MQPLMPSPSARPADRFGYGGPCVYYPGFRHRVTGTLISGTVHLGEQAMVYPRELEARIRQIEIHDQKPPPSAGQRVALNLAGLGTEEVERGRW